MTPRFISLIFFLVLIASQASSGENRERYIRENRLLEEEIEIARKPEVYLILDLRNNKAEIKVQGMLMRELPLLGFRYWGSPVAEKAYRVQKKSAFFKPGRSRIRPGKSENKDISLSDILELADMPSRYAIILDKGAVIYVRPEAEGVVSSLANLFHRSMNFVMRPISMLWHALRGKPYTALDIVLNENDARAIYWSLSEGSGTIVYPP